MIIEPKMIEWTSSQNGSSLQVISYEFVWLYRRYNSFIVLILNLLLSNSDNFHNDGE